MGISVREKIKGSGEWWVFLRHGHVRRSKKIGKRKEAEKIADRLRHELNLGNFGILEKKKEQMLFKDVASMWLEDHIKPFRRPSTFERYKSLLEKYVNPEIGNIPIDELKRGTVRALLGGSARHPRSPQRSRSGAGVVVPTGRA